jgi:hypothetical protein
MRESMKKLRFTLVVQVEDNVKSWDVEAAITDAVQPYGNKFGVFPQFEASKPEATDGNTG